MDHSLGQHSAVYAGRAVVATSYSTQDFGIGRRGIGIGRDHLAARVALDNRNHDLGSDAQLAADESVLRKAVRHPEVEIDVRPETPLVENAPDLLAELPGGLQREERKRPAIRHRPLG